MYFGSLNLQWMAVASNRSTW